MENTEEDKNISREADLKEPADRVFAKAQLELEAERLQKVIKILEEKPADLPIKVDEIIQELKKSLDAMSNDNADRLLAERKMVNDRLKEIWEKAERFKPGTPEREAAYRSGLDDIIRVMADTKDKAAGWDFSKEKTLPVFARDEDVVLRPINSGDVDFYIGITTQYTSVYREVIREDVHRKESLFLLDLCHPESFYCVIEVDGIPAGYLGIKDTRADVWEIAIELDRGYTGRGYGPESIKLFLNEVSRISGKTKFSALVETDNVPSQHCFEKLGELYGLHNAGTLQRSEDKALFEEKHLDLIDENMRSLAERLGVEPRKLLSHVLEYRITCPL